MKPPRPVHPSPPSVHRRLIRARDSLIADWTWSSGRALPPELRASAARRIGTLGLITVVTLLGFAALNVLSGLHGEGRPDLRAIAPLIGALSVAVVSVPRSASSPSSTRSPVLTI